VLTQDRLLAFARCIRSHRVPNFPDPQVVNGHIADMHAAGQTDPSSPIVTAAIAACRSTLGANSGAGVQKLVQRRSEPPARGQGQQRQVTRPSERHGFRANSPIFIAAASASASWTATRRRGRAVAACWCVRRRLVARVRSS
jgi:hypothetical protein